MTESERALKARLILYRLHQAIADATERAWQELAELDIHPGDPMPALGPEDDAEPA